MMKYGAINGTPVNSQPLTVKPFIYMLVTCPSDDHQLLYCLERFNDIYITNIMCAFKGDNTASQLESGQQKNGDYFC